MFKNVISRIKDRLVYFGKNSNIHGVRYISDNNYNWFSRIFWISALQICGWGLLVILKGTLNSLTQDTLSFTLDTNRLLWNTAFPSITVCEKYHYLSVLRKLHDNYPDLMDSISFDDKRFLSELFFKDSTCNLCKQGCGSHLNCSMDLRAITEKVRAPCSQLIHTCSWQGVEFDCCKYFLPIDSQYGLCYSVNTLQSRLSGTVPRFKFNRTTGPGFLSFHVHKRLLVYIHGGEDVPWIKTELDMRFDVNDNIEFQFQIIEMSNDINVNEIGIDVRKCRYPNEKVNSEFEKPFQVYGYTACMTTCETEIMFKKCQCVHHLRDKIFKEVTCNVTGLMCLSSYEEERSKMNSEEANKRCEHCVPSCEEIQLTKVYYNKYDADYDPRVDIIMAHLPNIRYRRNVVRSNLDFVVSIGGLAGLFFGASLLSIVEAVYLIFFRKT